MERLSEQLEEGDFEPPPPAPLSDFAKSFWISCTGVAWLFSVVTIGSPEQLGVGVIPFLVVCIGSAVFERRRDRSQAAWVWIGAGGAWLAALLWLPARALLVIRDSLP